MKKGIIRVVVIIACLAGIYYIINKNKEKNEAETRIVAEKNPNVSVTADTVKIRSVDTKYHANGTFMPFQEMELAAESMGRVTKVMVDDGSFIKAGQTLAVIEDNKVSLGVEDAQAVYNSAKADLERVESAYASGGVTQQQLDQVKLQYENAKNNLRSAQINASETTIRSSIDGIVNQRMIEPGSYVNMGTPAFDIVSVSTLKLRVNVDEKNITSLKVGQTIPVKVSVYPNEIFEGKVTFIAPKANNSLSFPVEIQVQNNSENALKAGMYGTAMFGGEAEVDALVVPRRAFVGSVSTNEIFVIRDSVAHLINVSSGRNFGDYVEVTGGLEEGDKVVTTGQINLIDGTPVKIIQ